jgi:hypothetical protein
VEDRDIDPLAARVLDADPALDPDRAVVRGSPLADRIAAVGAKNSIL